MTLEKTIDIKEWIPIYGIGKILYNSYVSKRIEQGSIFNKPNDLAIMVNTFYHSYVSILPVAALIFNYF